MLRDLGEQPVGVQLRPSGLKQKPWIKTFACKTTCMHSWKIHVWSLFCVSRFETRRFFGDHERTCLVMQLLWYFSFSRHTCAYRTYVFSLWIMLAMCLPVVIDIYCLIMKQRVIYKGRTVVFCPCVKRSGSHAHVWKPPPLGDATGVSAKLSSTLETDRNLLCWMDLHWRAIIVLCSLSLV